MVQILEICQKTLVFLLPSRMMKSFVRYARWWISVGQWSMMIYGELHIISILNQININQLLNKKQKPVASESNSPLVTAGPIASHWHAITDNPANLSMCVSTVENNMQHSHANYGTLRGLPTSIRVNKLESMLEGYDVTIEKISNIWFYLWF